MMDEKITIEEIEPYPASSVLTRYIYWRYDNLYIFLTQLWHEDTRPSDLASHICFLVVSSVLQYFIILGASMMETFVIVFSDRAVTYAMFFNGWVNFFLNILFVLIVIEVSQMIGVAYWKWKRDNL